MLKGSLYHLIKIAEENNIIEAVVELNKSDDIFKGHFPDQPVLPGVCMMQMIREILETFFQVKLQLLKADDVRFTAMVDPTKDAQLIVQIQFIRKDNSIQTKSKIPKMDEIVCCKMQATFVFA